MPAISRKTMLRGAIGLAVVAIAAVVLHSLSRSALPSMNVLLVTLDTTRADRLSCYGYDRETSPRIDAFARDATQFDLAIAQAANTPVSHASILTGLDPYHHGLRVLHGMVGNRLAESQTTLAEVWRQAGGETAAFVSAFPTTRAFGLGQGFEVFDERFLVPGNTPVDSHGIVNTGPNQRRSDETTQAALRWLERRPRGGPPFFLWVHYFDPHDTVLLPPREALERFPPRADSPEDRLRAVYDAEIYFMDDQVGMLFDSLRASGAWNDTIVVVVADHGEGQGDHGWWSHGILYQEQIRVPLLIRIPRLRTLRHVTQLVRSVDIMPTVLRQSAVPERLWPAMDGLDLTRLLQGASEEKKRVAYSDGLNILTYGRPDGKGGDVKKDKLYGILSGGWKLIYHQIHPERSELYNLDEDPGEAKNLYPVDLAQRDLLKKSLESLHALSGIMPGMGEEDYERAERLRSLGYIH